MRDIVSTRVTQGDPQNTNNNNKRGPSAQCTTGQHVTPPFYLLPDQLNQGPLFVAVVVVAIVVVVVALVWGHLNHMHKTNSRYISFWDAMV